MISNDATHSLPVEVPPPAWRWRKDVRLVDAAIGILQDDGGIMSVGKDFL
jgi:hypothetical protein